MKSIVSKAVVSCFLMFLLYGVTSAAGESLAGKWVGEFAFEGGTIPAHVAFDSLTTGSNGICLLEEVDLAIPFNLSTLNDSLYFTLRIPELGELSVAGVLVGDKISGDVTHGSQSRQFYLRRLYEVGPTELARQIGFYRNSDGAPLCVMYRVGGGLMFYDFDGLVVGSRYPIGENEYARFDDHGEVSSRWTFVTRGSGEPGKIEIRNDDGTSESWPRIDDAPFSQHLVSYANGDVRLSGVLLTPAEVENPPSVVYIHGSGANNTRNNYYDLFICQYLARNGIAVLLPDKRGSGESSGDWRTAHMMDFAADAIAGVEYLKTIDRIDSIHIGVLGFSQGGHVTPIVAATPGAVAFAVDVSGSALPLAETVSYEVEQLAVEAGLNEADKARVMKLQADAIAFVSEEISWETFHQELQEAIESEWAGREISAGFPQTEDHWKWGFHRRNRDFDPIDYWKKVAVPALIVFGQKDTQVPVGESLIRLDQEITGPAANLIEVEVYRNSGHAIGDPKTGWISREFLDALVGWIAQQAH